MILKLSVFLTFIFFISGIPISTLAKNPALSKSGQQSNTSFIQTVDLCSKNPNDSRCKGGMAAAAGAVIAAKNLIKGKDAKSGQAGGSAAAPPSSAELNQQLKDMCATNPSLCKLPSSSPSKRPEPSPAVMEFADFCSKNPNDSNCPGGSVKVIPKGGKGSAGQAGKVPTSPPTAASKGGTDQPKKGSSSGGTNPETVSTPKESGETATAGKQKQPDTSLSPQPSTGGQVQGSPSPAFPASEAAPSSLPASSAGTSTAPASSPADPAAAATATTSPPASSAPSAAPPPDAQAGPSCSSSYQAVLTENEFNNWMNSYTTKGTSKALCDITQYGPKFYVCCKNNPGVDFNGNVTQEDKPATDEPQEAITPQQKEACQLAEEKVYVCQSQVPTAERDCDPDQGAVGQWKKGLEVGVGGTTMIAQSSIQAACLGASQLNGALSAAVASLEAMCQSSRDKCISSCQQAKASFEKCPSIYPGYAALSRAVGQLDDTIKTCEKYGDRVQSARQGFNGVLASLQASQQCAVYLKAMNQPSLCQRDPLAPGCANLANQNCSNPAFAAGNKICICNTTPGDPICQTSGPAFGGAGSGFGAGTASGAPLNAGLVGSMGENSGGTLSGSDSFASLAAGGAGAAGAPGEDPGGKKNSGAALNPNSGGGGHGGGGGDGGGGSGYERNSQQVYSGNWGSSGGGGGLNFRSGSSGSGGSGGYMRNPSTADINQFKPYMRMNKFSPGVMGLTGPDGLTGPNSNTIWQKVRNRYQAKIYSLKQRP